MELENVARLYFKLFSDKDIVNLKKLFSKNITLRDWELHANGIDDVVKANRDIFNNTKSISVKPKNIYQDGLVAVCEIQILINDIDILNVIDVIKFDKNKKIVNISAYKQ